MSDWNRRRSRSGVGAPEKKRDVLRLALSERHDRLAGDGAPVEAGDGKGSRAAGAVAKRAIVAAWRAVVRRAGRIAGAFPAQHNRLAPRLFLGPSLVIGWSRASCASPRPASS